VRRLIAVAAGWFVVACASAGQPPGGPDDHDPPVILSVKPESGQLNIRPGQIDFQFDEVVAQQALGATDLSKLFLVSPRNGDPDVSWHRKRITIKLHGQFRTNTAYIVTMFPGLADLRGNVRKEGATIIFSTGPTIPRFGITGVLFDWAAQHTVPNAYIEAMLRSDTTLKFVGVSDTTGHFEIGPLDTGTYLVRGLIDQNSNHQVDRNEKWDSTVAHVTDVRPARRHRARLHAAVAHQRDRRRQRDDPRRVRQVPRPRGAAAACAHRGSRARFDSTAGRPRAVGGRG
jgi:hypothetical protein